MMNAFRERLEHYVVMDREIQLSDVSQNDDSLHEGDEIPVVDTDSEPEVLSCIHPHTHSLCLSMW